MMYSALIFAVVAPAALSSAIPTFAGPAVSNFFDKRDDDLTATAPGGKTLHSDILAGIALNKQKTYQAAQKPEQWKKCNAKNIVVRREWSTFSSPEKTKYLSAVQCLSKLPPKTPKSVCPGCKNRYDDFVATHIQQTFFIHGTGNFLPWHRFYVWAYEQTLRNECGYKGYHPYYNWPKWSDNPLASPLLDGSATSVGGNGVAGCPNQTFWGIPNNEAPIVSIPKGTGGGCINSGPFKDWVVNLGPGFTLSQCTPPNPIANPADPQFGLAHNPRCIKRDISSWVSSQFTNDKEVTKVLKSKDIATFWADLQGGIPVAFGDGMLGVHAGGHFTINGDPGSDFATSAGDPYFYFHHGQVDRTWWIWQNQDPATRTNALYGTIVINDLTAPATQLTDKMSLGYAWPGELTIAETMSTMGGPFCYTYI